MREYPEGSYKFDPATNRIAVRTSWPDAPPLVDHAWCVASPVGGGSFRSSADVDSWIDIPPNMIAELAFGAGQASITRQDSAPKQ